MLKWENQIAAFNGKRLICTFAEWSSATPAQSTSDFFLWLKEHRYSMVMIFPILEDPPHAEPT
jgi:hypothetical protein